MIMGVLDEKEQSKETEMEKATWKEGALLYLIDCKIHHCSAEVRTETRRWEQRQPRITGGSEARQR